MEDLLAGTIDDELYAPRERCALALAEELTREPEALPEELHAEATRHFSQEELMELLMVVGIFNYFNRFNNALEMPPTAPSPYLEGS